MSNEKHSKNSCGCGCGHDHPHHDHKHEHKHGGESCGCAMCQLEDLTHLSDDHDEENDDCHCGCGHEHKHEHEHHHHDHGCSCGHDHSHGHKHEHKHEGESCGCAMCQLEDLTHLSDDCEEDDDCHCGHDHHHHHEHEHHSCSCGCEHEHKHEHEHHHHDHACSCGHDHSHDHKHEHKHEGESCGCAMCQLEDLTHLSDDHDEEDDDCHCGHDHHHHHEHEHHSCSCGCGHEHKHEHEHHHHDHGCSCGHDHSHDHKHEHKHEGESCGCAMCQLENVKVSEEVEETPTPVAAPAKKDFKLPELSMPVLALITIIMILASMVPAISMLKPLYYLVAIVLWGKGLFEKGWKAAKRKTMDEHVLTSIAVIAAFLIGEYFEALMVALLFAIGDWLELKAVQRSRKDIAAVVNIRPQRANLIQKNGEIQNILSKKLRIDDRIQVKVGERVPVDCVILEGNSTMDRSAITGESVAVGVQPGDRVLSGEVNLSGVLVCRCETTYENSTASRIIQLVEESSAQKGETEKFITRFAKYYTPAVVVMAILTVLVPPVLGWGSFRMWLERALVFLVASCPCALVISVPLAFFSGVGAMSKQGVLLKGTKFIEPLSKVKTLVCDKTGTITTGELQVSNVEVFSDAYDMRAVTALAEKYSSHPVAQAICKAFTETMEADVKQVEEFAGKGVSLLMDGKKVLCGSARLMRENGINMDNVVEANVYTAVAGELIGCVMLSDVPRKDAVSTMKELKAMGVERTVMLTGDSAISASVVKEQVGMDEMHCGLLPQDKAALMKELKQNGKTTVFVGDGINDAPVLAAADIGFAMGLGTDAAIESADAVLMSDNLSALPKVVGTARRTVSIVKFNIAFILISKAIVLILGLTGHAPMWLAVVADVGVSILCVLNAVRILRNANK